MEKMYRLVMCFQGESGDELADLMHEEGIDAAFNHAVQWDYGEEVEPRVNKYGMREWCGHGDFYRGEHGYVLFKHLELDLFALYCEVDD